jgi:hypothetical protein
MEIERVVRQMVESAEILPDRSGLYYGSPRPLMEVPGISVSSGNSYEKLRAMGIRDLRKGKNGIWSIPSVLIDRYVS